MSMCCVAFISTEVGMLTNQLTPSKPKPKATTLEV